MNLKLIPFLLATRIALIPSLFGALLDENHESKKDVSTCLQQTLSPAEVKRRLFNLVQDKVDPMSETLKFSIFETVDMLMKTGYIETFSFKHREAAFEMGEIIRVLLPYFNPEDLTGHVSTFIERLRKKTRNEFGSIVPLDLRNLGLINMCENHPLKEGVSIVDSQLDLEKATSLIKII